MGGMEYVQLWVHSEKVERWSTKILRLQLQLRGIRQGSLPVCSGDAR